VTLSVIRHCQNTLDSIYFLVLNKSCKNMIQAGCKGSYTTVANNLKLFFKYTNIIMDSSWPMIWLLKNMIRKTSNKTNLVCCVIFCTQYPCLTTQPQDDSIVLWKPMSISQKARTVPTSHQYEALIMMYLQFSTETKYTIYGSPTNLVYPPIFFFISVSSITFSRNRMSMGMNKENSTVEREVKQNW
jgi:hypothetical protein